MAEESFFDEGEVKVTSARFIIPSQTYALSGVTSVKNLKEAPSKKWPIILIVIGFFILALSSEYSGSGGIIFGLLVAGGGIAWLILSKPRYYVVLSSASGETKSLSSQDSAYISRVIAALNDAIVHRG
jgi:hypothetical protein